MEKQRKLQNILKEINQLCCKEKDVLPKLRRELDHYCRKRYLFDIIYFFHAKIIHSSAIEVVSESFLNGDKELGILFLFAFLHQSNPEELIFDDSEFFGLELDNFDAHIYIIIAKYIMKLDLPSNEFKSVCEYFLRRVVANLFISSIRTGTGNFFDGWDTDDFYGGLLTNKLDFEKDEICFTPDSVKRVVSLIAQKFHEHNLPNLDPTFDFSYFCIKNEFLNDFFDFKANYGSKKRFIAWQRSKKILPECYWLIQYGFIIPEEGLLVPNSKKLFSLNYEEELVINTNYGFLDLTSAAHVLRSFIDEKHLESVRGNIDFKSFNEFKESYLVWHEDLGLLDEFEKRFVFM